MDQGPLVSEQLDAGARFLDEFQKYLPVQDAFWLKDSDEGAWYLYVASEQITDENFDVGYGEVGRMADTIQNPSFDVLAMRVMPVPVLVAVTTASGTEAWVLSTTVP